MPVRYSLRLALAVFAVSLAFPVFARPRTGPVTVTAAAVTLSPLPDGPRALGAVDSLGRTILTAPSPGMIVGPFTATGMVAAGTIIARDVPPALHDRIAAARAAVTEAGAAEKRARDLVAQRLRPALALAQRDLAQARARLAGLRRDAAQQVIRAPFAGTLRYLVAPGTFVPGGTSIAILDGRGRPWIDLRLPPQAVRRLRPGMAARITADGWSGTGRVAAIGTDARPLGLVSVRVALPRRNPLLPGQWVRVRLLRTGPPAATVPAGSVVMRQGRDLVFVLNGDTVRGVPVRVLAERHGSAWLAGPLHPGDRVAVAHAARLTGGASVILRPARRP